MNRFSKPLPLAMEGLLLVLALVWVLMQASQLQKTAGEGVTRWQLDLVNAKASDMPASLRRTWCRRDNQWLSGTDHAALLDSCADHFGMRILIVLTPASSHQVPVEMAMRWRQELVEHTNRWRNLLAHNHLVSSGSDSNLGSHPGLSAPADSREIREQQRIDEALGTWDAWVNQHLPSATSQDLDALWRMAVTLDGMDNEEPARLIRHYRKRMDQSDKASRSLTLVNDLPWWLTAHWMFSVLGMAMVRSPLPVRVQWQGLVLICMGGLLSLSQAHLIQLPVSVSVFMASGMALLAGIWWLNLFGKSTPTSSGLVSLRVLLPGWWLFTAIGWLLLLDESLNFHPRLRFLAADQWWTWCLASVILPFAVMLSPQTLSVLQALTRFSWAKTWGLGQTWRWLLAVFVLGVFALAHRGGIPAHVTGEAMKMVFVFSAAGWCVWKMPLASQLWHESHVRRSMLLMSGMLALIALTALIAGLTSDKGPWLVIAIVAVMLMASVMGWTTGLGLLLTGFLCIFMLGERLDVVADRLQAWRDAFTANHDDMARLLWFQHEASLQDHGWGIGQTPWCAGVKLDPCWGLPLQLQSDYTFTALVGWWGPMGAWFCVVCFSLYVYAWLMHAAKQSHTVLAPDKLIQPGFLGQALSLQMLFLTGLWVLVQTWITVCGNLGWLPLTGITWPLISYGKTSLWLTTFLMGTWGFRRSHA